MGTRNLTCVVLNKQYKVAQYGQWDGYPSGQGATVYKFLKSLSQKDLAVFRERVTALREATEAEVKEKWEECGADGSGWVTLDVGKTMEAKYPHLSRGCGAEILQLVFNGKATALSLATEFAGSSLHCEWAYVVDLDNDTLEVYRGFQTKPHTGQRFSDFDYDKEMSARIGRTYYPIAFLDKFRFSDLPETVEEFVEILEFSDAHQRKLAEAEEQNI